MIPKLFIFGATLNTLNRKGDLILFSSDAELAEALRVMRGSCDKILRFYLKAVEIGNQQILNQKKIPILSKSVIHENVRCDICSKCPLVSAIKPERLNIRNFDNLLSLGWSAL